MKSYVGRMFAYYERFYVVLSEPFVNTIDANVVLVVWEDGSYQDVAVSYVGDTEDTEIL